MNDDMAYLFFQRLRWAEKLIRWLGSTYISCQQSPNEIRVWIVVDSWDDVSCPMWLDDLSDNF